MAEDPDSLQSVSTWIRRVREKDEVAALRLWDHFSDSLLRLAMSRLAGRKPTVADEEDVVVSVFRTLFRRLEGGTFEEVSNRHELWSLLVTITERKVLNLVRDQRRLKRGGGRVVNEVRCLRPDDSHQALDGFASMSPSPEFVTAMIEEVERLLGLLDVESREIAMRRLEGYSNDEISVQIGRSVATVERRLKLIRTRWAESEG